MTVAVETVFVHFVGNGSTKVFSVPFSAESVGDIRATAAGVAVVVSAYDRTAGTVMLASVPANGALVEIWRETRIDQTLDGNNNHALAPENIEIALDRTTRAQQELQELGLRAAKVERGQAAPNLPLPDEGKVIEWGANGKLNNSNISASEISVARDAAVASASAAASSEGSAASHASSASGHRLNASNAASTAVAARDVVLSAQESGIADGTISVAKLDTSLAKRILPTAIGSAGQVLTVNTDADGAGWSNLPTLADGSVTKEKLAVDIHIPVGTIIALAHPHHVEGYLFCGGAAVSRSVYKELFALIHTGYGAGDGTTTFNLPDYRGLFLRGTDWHRGLDPGRQFRSYQADTFKSHSHSYVDRSHHNTGSYIRGGGSGGSDKTYTTGTTGGDETRPKNMSINWHIKY